MHQNQVINLDCSFRDGGYYNNWSFKKKEIDFYLKNLSQTNIRYVEIGFRLLNSKNSGLTAYSDDKFIKSLKIKNNLKVGVMINASDFILDNKLDFNKLKKTFPNFKNLSFIRVAFHNKDLKNVMKISKFLSNKGPEIMLNLMQISELDNKEILKILKKVNQLKINVFYIADSFGSLKPTNIKNLSKILKKYCKSKIGFHAHDNLSLAYQNAIIAIKNDFDYLDSTMLGMGRGAGNLKTEEIYKFIYKDDKQGLKRIYNINKKIFKKLKGRYKWGTNRYYRFAATKSIHPSYIQELLNNRAYQKKNYKNILKSLANIDSKKYNPKYLINYNNKKLIKYGIDKIKLNKDILILGSSPNLRLFKKKIKKFIDKKHLSTIAVNLNSIFEDRFIDYRVASHPNRIQIDHGLYKKFDNKLILPSNILNQKIVNNLKKQKNLMFNYNIKLSNNNRIIVKKNEATLPNFLVLGYALSIAVSKNAKNIFLAGFEGFKKDNYANDESKNTLEIFKKRFKKINIRSITPTKYNLEYKKIDE